MSKIFFKPTERVVELDSLNTVVIGFSEDATPLDKIVGLVSSDTSIVDIASTVIPAVSSTKFTFRAKGIGTAKITAKSLGGSAVLSVTVVSTPKAIHFVENKLNVRQGQEYKPELKFDPATATNQGYYLSTSDSSVIDVLDDGMTLVGVNVGECEIYAYSDYDNMITTSVMAKCVSNEDWIDVELTQFLTPAKIDNIYFDVLRIKDMLDKKGYSGFSPIEVSASMDTQYSEILDILQNMEYNLDGIYSVLQNNGIELASYGSDVTIGEYALGRDGIQRWIDVLNEAREKLDD